MWRCNAAHLQSPATPLCAACQWGSASGHPTPPQRVPSPSPQSPPPPSGTRARPRPSHPHLHQSGAHGDSECKQGSWTRTPNKVRMNARDRKSMPDENGRAAAGRIAEAKCTRGCRSTVRSARCMARQQQARRGREVTRMAPHACALHEYVRACSRVHPALGPAVHTYRNQRARKPHWCAAICAVCTCRPCCTCSSLLYGPIGAANKTRR